MNSEESLLLWLNLAMSPFNPNLHSGFQPEPELKVTINQLNLTDQTGNKLFKDAGKSQYMKVGRSPQSCTIMGGNHSWAV